MLDYERIESVLKKNQDSSYAKMKGRFWNVTPALTEDGIKSLPIPVLKGLKVLDVGVGVCVATEKFKEHGCIVTGITSNEDEAVKAREKGHDVRVMSMESMDFPDKTFNVVWARHCLEHSMMPFVALSEMHRVLQYKGKIFIEVPAPDMGGHEGNPNHFSVMGYKMWSSLVQRAGFNILTFEKIGIREKESLVDKYYRIIAERQTP